MPEDWSDDTGLAADLRDAVRAADAVPASFLDVGRAAFAWRDPDARLADLAHDAQWSAGLRADPAAVRALTFAGDGVTIELEITADALLGQLVPPGADRVRVHGPGGRVAEVEVDEVGWFAVRPRPDGLVRLSVDIGDRTVVTAWTRI